MMGYVIVFVVGCVVWEMVGPWVKTKVLGK